MRKLLLLFMAMTLTALYAFSQNKTVSGSVTDKQDGKPLAGVTVTVKGTSVSTSTQPDGSFRLSVPANAKILVFSSIGYAEFETAIGAGAISVQMTVGANALSEVVITGYTTQTKRQVAGSVAKVMGDDIKMQPVGSFDNALQGKVAGLLSISGSGQPGSAASVTIRGMGSINGSNTPLYIIDGVQVNAADFATLNPGDIETYNVLKDAASTAIYGSRGANGVIVITTKRGSAGQTHINYDFQYGYSELPENKLKLMNSAEKIKYEQYETVYGPNPYGWSQAEQDSLSKVDNHIKNILFQKGITQQHELSASGGNEKTRFYLSGSIFDQQGVVKTTSLKRYTGRVNIDNTFGNFKIGLNATFGYSRSIGTLESNAYIGSPLNAIRWFLPYVSLYDKNGNLQDDYVQIQPNPLKELTLNYNNGDETKGVGSAYVEYAIPGVKGLKLKTIWGGDFTESETFNYLDKNSNQGIQSVGGEGEVDRAYAKVFRYTGTSSINYQRTFDEHEINVSLFNEIIQSKSEGFGFSGFGITGPFKNEAGITPGTANNGFIPTVGGSASSNSLVSYFIDGNYGYKRKYYFNAGARRDGSSRLNKNDRYATFGYVGFSWIMSDEKFMERTENWLSALKYKISYGSVGSQGIGDYSSLELLSPSVYNGVTGLILTNLPVPLTWERKVMFNTGVEFSLFKSKLDGTIEVYSNTTKDLFLNRQLSQAGSGFTSITNNLGQLRNQGIEVSLTATIIRNKDLMWSITGNYAHNMNKLINQAGNDHIINGIFINQVGKPINSLYLVKYAGVDPQTGDALYYKHDGSTTNIYDPNDRVIIGTTDPPNFGGFGTTVNYKGIELSVLFTYAFGSYVFNNDQTNVENPQYWFSELSEAMINQWQKPGDKTNIPSGINDFHAETSRFVQKDDYIRFRNIQVAYNLPATLTNKWKIKSLRFFAQGQNLFVWSKVLSYDPEVPGGNLTGSQYPQLKNVTFGLNLGL